MIQDGIVRRLVSLKSEGWIEKEAFAMDYVKVQGGERLDAGTQSAIEEA